MKRAARVLVYVLLIAVIPICVFLFLPATVRYQITERYALSTGQADVNVRLAVLLPKSGPYQAVKNVMVEWPGEETREGHESVDVIALEGKTESGGTVQAVLAYEVSLRHGRPRWAAPVRERHLAPEEEIESDAPVLVAEAKEVASVPSREGAYLIYAFTVRHLSWPSGSREGGDQSALAAYESGTGVCGEHANLMAALCRAAGIPAKSITGLFLPELLPPYVTKTRAGLHPGGSHAWVEVYTGGEWEMVDPSRATHSFLDRLWFGRSSGYHLSYGESGQHDRIYGEATEWAKGKGETVVGMWAPLRFVASAEDADVAVQPTVSVRKTSDARWLCAVGSYVALVFGCSIVEGRLRRTRQRTA